MVFDGGRIRGSCSFKGITVLNGGRKVFALSQSGYLPVEYSVTTEVAVTNEVPGSDQPKDSRGQKSCTTVYNKSRLLPSPPASVVEGRFPIEYPKE